MKKLGKKIGLLILIPVVLGISLYIYKNLTTEYLDLNNLSEESHCHIERTCGELVGVDCDSAIDGPYYYVNSKSNAIVGYCGGYCMGGDCTNCPPKEWTCKTY